MKKIFFIIIIFLHTGCWNYRELNNCAIVTGMAIDYTDNEYHVSLLFSNSTKDNKKISILNETGKTINEAIKKIGLESPKEIYLSHLSYVIVSEQLAKKNITPVIDYLLREPESNQNFNLLIAKKYNVEEILSTVTSLSDYPSQNINATIKIAEKEQARVIKSDFNSFVSTLLKPGINPIANSIMLTDDKNNNKLDSLAIFKDNKLIEWATIDESIGINMLRGNVKNLYTSINIDDKNLVINCINYKNTTKFNTNKLNINIYCEGSISEMDRDINLNNIKTISLLEKKVEKKLLEYTEKAIKKCKDLKIDSFGFGNLLYKKQPNKFKRIKDWDEYFSNLEININTNFKLTSTGSLLESIGEINHEK